MKRLFEKQISFPNFLLSILFSVVCTFLLTYYINHKKLREISMQQAIEYQSLISQSQIGGSCHYNVKRLNGYSYIRPILFVDDHCQSEELEPVKKDITDMIAGLKKEGTINAASVYVRDYANNEWFSINEDETYKPGSLLKVPELIAILKMDEKTPGFLNKKIKYDHPYDNKKMGLYQSNSIELGHTYTVKELLTYMIAYSDNRATALLNANIDYPTFTKVFTDMGLKAPDWNAGDYPISVKDYSIFMRALYNSCYLSNENSEYATQLLSQCDFKKGLLKGLPDNIKIAHKFGETGNATEQQLHESALVYLNNRTYLLTVMTRGANPQDLPLVISQISNVIYQSFKNSSTQQI